MSIHAVPTTLAAAMFLAVGFSPANAQQRPPLSLRPIRRVVRLSRASSAIMGASNWLARRIVVEVGYWPKCDLPTIAGEVRSRVELPSRQLTG
jgi:hypothetical protein